MCHVAAPGKLFDQLSRFVCAKSVVRIFIIDITLYEGYGLSTSVLCYTVGTEQAVVAVIFWICAREVSGSNLSYFINDRLCIRV